MIKKTLSGLSLFQVLILHLLKWKEKTHVVLFSKQERVRSFFRLFFFFNKNVPVDRHHHSNVINDLFTNTLFSFELFHVSIITGTTEIVYSIYQMIS